MLSLSLKGTDAITAVTYLSEAQQSAHPHGKDFTVDVLCTTGRNAIAFLWKCKMILVRTIQRKLL